MPTTRLSSHSSSSSPTLSAPQSPVAKTEPQQQRQQVASQIGKKRHQCQHCERSFTTSGHLARHSRVHTGERNHKCPFPGCETKCSRQDNLQQHYRIHLAPGSRRASTKTVSRRSSRQNSTTDVTTSTAVSTPLGLDDSYPSPPPLDQPPALEEATLEGLQRGRGVGARAIITPPASYHSAQSPSAEFSSYSGRSYPSSSTSYHGQQPEAYSPSSSSRTRPKEEPKGSTSPSPSSHSGHSNTSKRLSISDLSHPQSYSGSSYQYSQPYPANSYPADSPYQTPAASTYDVSPQSYSPAAPYSNPAFVEGRRPEYERDYHPPQGSDYYQHASTTYSQPGYERPSVYRENSSYSGYDSRGASSYREDYINSSGSYQLPPVDFPSRTSAIF